MKLGISTLEIVKCSGCGTEIGYSVNSEIEIICKKCYGAKLKNNISDIKEELLRLRGEVSL